MAPEAEAAGDSPELDAGSLITSEQFAEMKREQEESARRTQELMLVEAQRLKALMEKDPDIERYAYMMLLGNRLAVWAASALSEFKGMTSMGLKVLADSQQELAAHRFDAAEMLKDLINKQMPWLESRRKDMLMREQRKIGRLKAVNGMVRNKVVPVPFEALNAAFKEDEEFAHTDLIIVYGPREALDPVLRHCALHYQTQGGRTVLLSNQDGDDGDERIADFTIPPGRWRNAGDIYGEFIQVMEPVVKEQIKPYGLLVVEDLDSLLRTTPIQEPRPRRLVRAMSCLAQFQSHYPMAIIMGVATDDDPEGLELDQMYPPFLLMPPHIEVKLEPSELVPDSMNVIIGDEITPLRRMKMTLQPPGE